ncbi:MAG: hypothetical protein ACYDC1_16230, partial [Limisphaerales bacterium]
GCPSRLATMATVRVPPLSMPNQTGSEQGGLRCRMGRVFVPGNGRQGEWAGEGEVLTCSLLRLLSPCVEPLAVWSVAAAARQLVAEGQSAVFSPGGLPLPSRVVLPAGAIWPL